MQVYISCISHYAAKNSNLKIQAKLYNGDNVAQDLNISLYRIYITCNNSETVIYYLYINRVCDIVAVSHVYMLVNYEIFSASTAIVSSCNGWTNH